MAQRTELALVIPTFNERDNVAPLLEKLRVALDGIQHEIVFVDDDSPDGTAEAVREFTQSGVPVRVIQRIGRRGLSSACIEGMLSCAADYIAVMDADLQHDETKLPIMLAKIRSEQLDLVVASRHIGDGAIGSGMNKKRTALSNMGKKLTASFHTDKLTDPMSGFFMVRRRYFETLAHRLSGIGFKILLDIVLSGPADLRMGEVPFQFRERQHGASKLDILVGLEYLELLLDKRAGSTIPVRFILFSLVGVVGVAVHLVILTVLLRVFHTTFLYGQIVAATVVMVLNYVLNNVFSYRDRRRRGLRFWTGLVGFCLACSLGLLANASIADEAYVHGVLWPLAAIIGLLFGAVWNYGVTSVITWRGARRRTEQIAHKRLAARELVQSKEV